eukprot:3767475-Heterocapsa_arctica.AAC.1
MNYSSYMIKYLPKEGLVMIKAKPKGDCRWTARGSTARASRKHRTTACRRAVAKAERVAAKSRTSMDGIHRTGKW